MKKNKKLWSFALAGALAVSNLSAVAIPITAFASNLPTGTLTLEATSGYGKDTVDAEFTFAATLSSTQKIWIDIDDSEDSTGSVSTDTGAKSDCAGGTAEETITLGNVNAGVLTVNAYYDSDTANSENDVEILATKTITITKSALTSVSISEKNSYSKVNQTGTLNFKASETYNSKNVAEDIVWKVVSKTVYDSADEYSEIVSATSVTTGVTIESNAYDATKAGATSYSEDVEVSLADVDAGNYYMVAYAADAEKWAATPFEVVDDATLPTVVLKKGNYTSGVTSGDILSNETLQLTAYVDAVKTTSGLVFTSSNNAAATVNNSGLISGAKAGSADINAKYTVENNVYVSTESPFTVTVTDAAYSIDSSEKPNEIVVGDSFQLHTLLGSEDVGEDGTTWVSKDNDVATVKDGLVTAVGAGKVNIQATFPDSTTARIQIEVVDEATATTPTYGIFYGKNYSVNTTVTYPETLQLSVLNTSDHSSYSGSVIWKVDNDDYATVKNGLFTPLEDGVGQNVTVTALDAEAESIDTIVITIESDALDIANWAVDSVGGSATTNINSAGNDGNFTGAVLFVDDSMTLTPSYKGTVVTNGTWKLVGSSSAITVTSAGVVKSVNTGSGTVQFEADLDGDGKITAATEHIEVAVTVTSDAWEIYAGDENAENSVSELELGKTLQMSVKYGAEDRTGTVVYESSKTSVATISASGLITPVSEGVTVISVYYPTKANATKTVTFNLEVIAATTETKVTDALESAIANANAANKAATDAAEAAEKAAKAAEANPTAETVKAAQDAAATATAAAKAAEDAAKEVDSAKDAYDDAGLTVLDAEANDVIYDAGVAAKAATDAANTATDAATAAQAKVDEAAKKAEEEKKQQEEQKAAAEKAAAQATGATGTDSASGNAYKVTDGSSKTVAITKAADSASGKVTIPSTVTISGDKFTVTEISANAFKGNKKIKQVVIPKTVTKIGKNAFKNCSKVTKITIKATKNLTVGKNAFKGLKDGSKIVVKGVSGSAKKKLVKKIKKQVTSSRTTVK